MLEEGIGRTTEIDAHGHVTPRHTLEKMASAVNAPEGAQVNLINHDWSIPPIGKVIRAAVRPLDDGSEDFALHLTFERFEGRNTIQLPSGTSLVVQGSENDVRPFSFTQRDYQQNLVSLVLEARNFPTVQELKSFKQEIDTSPISCQLVIQHEKDLLVTPSLLFLLGYGFLGWYGLKVSSKVVDKIADKHAEKIIENTNQLIQLSKQAVISFKKHRGEAASTPMFRHQIQGDPIVELVYRGEDEHWAKLGFSQEALEAAFDQARELKEHANAAYVQFVFDDKCLWKLNWAATDKGEIVASEYALSMRDSLLREIEEECRSEGRTVGLSPAYVPTEIELREKS